MYIYIYIYICIYPKGTIRYDFGRSAIILEEPSLS